MKGGATGLGYHQRAPHHCGYRAHTYVQEPVVTARLSENLTTPLDTRPEATPHRPGDHDQTTVAVVAAPAQETMSVLDHVAAVTA